MAPQIAAVLPAHIPVDRFKRVVMTAVNQTPDLMKADRRSLFNACVKCAADGLVPDGREAALVTFGGNAQYMPMVFGIIKKLRQSGEIASISARIVYENEIKEGRFRFVIEDGEEKLHHEPLLTGERGKPAVVYATAKFKDGTVQNEPMTVADVEKVRQASRAKNGGPWSQWWDEMARKTAIRRLSKYLPLSAEDRRLIDDDDQTEFDAMKVAAMQAQPQSIASAAAMLGGPVEVDQDGVITESGDQGDGPNQIPVGLASDMTTDWATWVRDAKAAVASAPDLDWLARWEEMHGAPMANLAKEDPEMQAAVLGAIQEQRSALKQAA